ncbi:murein L,D-transpeptidase catalytic domain family protein [Croceicoccus ponticola]|uniref:Murein L,D-transpeptidase catalytic domain family protein n=1 Tax=Croceicoccus ponticola TaxID=2217664 RepID=A0A437GZQ2_9SPHN|nr:murein L,D-transpeptidase catalytic domain family protein [Croceicoccus ponticola]RVQ68820.1 murein L,D-transpeptidase catalytic domain family protein [Croceicoccus ponticola]
MKLDRRRAIGALFAATSGLAAPRVFATPRKLARPAALTQALAALDRHAHRGIARDVIGLVDFTRPSRDRRFEIVDIANGRVVASYLVAHGRGSDPRNTGWVQEFSNRAGSNASSAGSYVIGDTYFGKHGRSRRLLGLDPTNSNAFDRAIVMHGADYVTPTMAAREGRIGRSLGCFAVEQHVRDEVLDRLGKGRLLFAAG